MPYPMLESTENILITKIDLVPALRHGNTNVRKINVVLAIINVFSIKKELINKGSLELRKGAKRLNTMVDRQNSMWENLLESRVNMVTLNS